MLATHNPRTNNEAALKKVTALIPIRHESERLKGKNYKLLGEYPLFAWILDTITLCPSINKVIVNTNSPIISLAIQKHFPQIKIINRPEHLTSPEISMNEIIRYDLTRVEGEFFLQTHATNPFLSIETIEKAIATYFESQCDSLFTVTKHQAPFWTHAHSAINHDSTKVIPSQDLFPVFEENSNLYIFSRKSFQLTGGRQGTQPYLFEMSKMESIDINNQDDFELAELIANNRLSARASSFPKYDEAIMNAQRH